MADPAASGRDGEMISFRSESTAKILNAIMMNPEITIKELSKVASVNEAAVNKQLKQLTDKQYIQRRENGEWHVTIYPSAID